MEQEAQAIKALRVGVVMFVCLREIVSDKPRQINQVVEEWDGVAPLLEQVSFTQELKEEMGSTFSEGKEQAKGELAVGEVPLPLWDSITVVEEQEAGEIVVTLPTQDVAEREEME